MFSGNATYRSSGVEVHASVERHGGAPKVSAWRSALHLPAESAGTEFDQGVDRAFVDRYLKVVSIRTTAHGEANLLVQKGLGCLASNLESTARIS